MDQVKIALNWIKQHHFWLLCGLVTLAGAGSWYMASSELSESFKKNSSIIKNEVSATSKVRSQGYHANEEINAAQRQENQQLAEKVRELWTSLYERQQEKALVWPKQLGDRFQQQIQGKQFGDPIPVAQRQVYQNYIKNYFPVLPKIVTARESGRRPSSGVKRSRRTSPAGRGSGGFGGGFGDPFGGGGGRSKISSRPKNVKRGVNEQEEEENYLVVWDDQQRIEEQLYLQATPSAIEMWVIQEDLWVYETLLKAIAMVNKAANADRYSNAAVRDIVALEVGQLAAESVRGAGDRIYRPESTGLGPAGLSGFPQPGPISSSLSRAPTGFDAQSSGGREDDLLTGRYIDGAGQPLPATPDNYKFGTEFKRLPIRLEMRMDQRWLPLLITGLSNAPLQVEVTEVRINPEASSSKGRSRKSKQFGGKSSRSQEVNAFSREPSVGDVILRGTVYIYNPVDEQVLSVGGDSA